MNFKKIVNIKPIQEALPVAGGYALGRTISKNFQEEGTTDVSWTGILVEGLAAGVAAGMMGKTGKSIAVGIALDAVFNGVRKLSPATAQTIGIAGVSPVYPNAIAGGYNYQLNGVGATVPQEITTD